MELEMRRYSSFCRRQDQTDSQEEWDGGQFIVTEPRGQGACRSPSMVIPAVGKW